MRESVPVKIEEFNGHFDRGAKEVVPPDHFTDTLNIRYSQLGAGTRAGFVKDSTNSMNGIRRVHLFSQLSASAFDPQRLLVMDSNGDIYDTTASKTIPILGASFDAGGSTDFSIVSMFGRAHITRHNRISGGTGGLVYVYDPASVYGTINTAVVNAGGAGYSVNDILTLTGGQAGILATVKVLTLGGGGSVATIQIVSRGTGYKATAANAVTGGTGAGATFTITILAAARPIGGAKPTSGVTAATSASAGNTEAGLHLIRVAYETESGFITQGNDTPTQYTAPGAKKIDISNIPLGPSAVIKRHLLVTRVIVNYTGRPDDYEFFFVPDGNIDDNTSTTKTIDFFDNDLQSSADYLLDQLESMASGVAMNSYQGSLVILGEKSKESVARVSKPGEPESFSSIDGFLIANPGDAGGGLKNSCEYRDLFYLKKSQRTYVTRNNGFAPATWDVNLVDNGIGTECFGVTIVLDAQGNTQDRYLIADRSGLLLFIGTYSEKALSWKIDDIWRRINPIYFNTIQVRLDPVAKLIYINVPLDSATEPSHVLCCDYNNGMDPVSVRWSIDQYHKKPTSIYIRSISSSLIKPRLEFGSSENDIFYQDSSAADDDGTAINSYAETFKAYHSDSGEVCQFSVLQFRITGAGTLLLTLNGLDDIISENPLSLDLSTADGFDLVRKIDFTSERMSVVFGTNELGERWDINRLMIFGKPTWAEYPQ